MHYSTNKNNFTKIDFICKKPVLVSIKAIVIIWMRKIHKRIYFQIIYCNYCHLITIIRGIINLA